jgi:molecular chaperone GrpE
MNQNEYMNPSPEAQTASQAQEPAADADASAVIQDMQGRLADIEDRWKRAVADLDNYRKRMDRENARLQIAERETVLRAWLPVIDNMERALCVEGASNNPWYEGMEAIHQQMLTVLAQFGVKPFVPTGEKFDPHLHDAVAAANLPDTPDGTIVDTVQAGYVLDGKVLRPAKVVAVRKSAG